MQDNRLTDRSSEVIDLQSAKERNLKMKAVNLHLLTRIKDPDTMSLLFQALSGRHIQKTISAHEAASLCSLVCFLEEEQPDLAEHICLLDGFFFSYVIEHIGKEFDLLKISADGSCALNIELKSEDIGAERIRKQLEQNRYYLSHASGTIYSFTYVMDTGTLYSLNEKGYFHSCPAADLVRILHRPALQTPLAEGIDRFFRSSDYLISPVSMPEKFLQGQYFLTNQQFDFKRRILEHLSEQPLPVVSITGSGGTGKTLLLFDLALALSRKNRVLIVHAGPLRRGHRLLDERLKNVDILSADDLPEDSSFGKYSCLLADEADHVQESVLEHLFSLAWTAHIPVICAYDPHQLVSTMLYADEDERRGFPPVSSSAALIERSSTLSLAFTGNIRINRPVYSFLHTLFCLKDRAGTPDYSCIDIVFAGTRRELSPLIRYYTDRGYQWIRPDAGADATASVIALEYEKILLVLDEEYFYDESGHLHVKNDEEARLRFLYECLSRTRENLCLVVMGNEPLFRQVLQIRQHEKE